MTSEPDAIAAMIAAQHNLKLDPEIAARGHRISTALRAHQLGCLVPINELEEADQPVYDSDALLSALMESVG
jgi:hypothetical protein